MDERLSFLCGVANRISELFLNKKEEDRKVFVKEIFDETEKAYINFRTILQHAYFEIEIGKMTVDDAIKYFDDERLPFKSSRAKIRGYMKHPYYQRNQELELFNIGVMGVLCGGLHYVTERSLECKIKKNDKFSDTVVKFKGNHTIVDIINFYDRDNMNSLFYSDFYQHYLEKKELEEAIRERLLVDIKKQIDKIDKSWQIVCDYYPKIMF